MIVVHFDPGWKCAKKRLKLCFQKQSATYDSCGREVEETLH